MPNANVQLAGTKADAASANGTASAACTNTNTAPTWTNKPGALRPVESQQVVTNSATQYINVPDEISPARRTYNPSTSAAGDTEAIAAKGRLVLVNGAAPALLPPVGMQTSELFSQRNMTYNENSIALPSDRGTLEVSGANLMYEGARVKSWMLGRDLNPGGRGYGDSFPHGAFALMNLRPQSSITPVLGTGNSVNNGGDDGGTTGDCGFCDGLPPCMPGYCGEECNCCSRCGDDPADKCCCSCMGLREKEILGGRLLGQGCLEIPLVMMCDFAPFEFADDHCQILRERKDMTYIEEFCASRRGQAACFDLNCPGHPITGWYCCYEYCKSMGFGDSGDGGGGGSTPVPPPGGGGCASCGGGGGSMIRSNQKRGSRSDANGQSSPIIKDFQLGLACLKAAVDDSDCACRSCATWHWPRTECDVCNQRVFETIRNASNNIFGKAKEGDRRCWDNEGTARYAFAYCKPFSITLCTDHFPITTIYGKDYVGAGSNECLSAALILFEAYKCVIGATKGIDCVEQIIGLAIDLCECAKASKLC